MDTHLGAPSANPDVINNDIAANGDMHGDIHMATPATINNTPTPVINLNSPGFHAQNLAHFPQSSSSHGLDEGAWRTRMNAMLPMPIVEFQARENEPQFRFWTSSVVAHFVCNHDPDDDIQARLESIWNTGIRVRNLAPDVLLINFLDGNEGDRIMAGSPWALPSCYLILQLWEAGVSPFTLDIVHVPTWIEIKGLPLEYWPVHHLSRVVKQLGTLVCIEDEGLFYSDLRWLRALILVDLTKPRYTQVHVRCGVNMNTIKISYEGNHCLFSRCDGFGHHHSGCGGPPGSGKDWSRNYLLAHGNHGSENEEEQNNDGEDQTQGQQGGGMKLTKPTTKQTKLTESLRTSTPPCRQTTMTTELRLFSWTGG